MAFVIKQAGFYTTEAGVLNRPHKTVKSEPEQTAFELDQNFLEEYCDGTTTKYSMKIGGLL